MSRSQQIEQLSFIFVWNVKDVYESQNSFVHLLIDISINMIINLNGSTLFAKTAYETLLTGHRSARTGVKYELSVPAQLKWRQ